MVEWVLEKVSNLGDDLIITTNNKLDYLRFGLRTASDEKPGAGALPGLKTALTNVRGEYVLVVACDMPFLNEALLRYEVEQAFQTEADIVVPEWDGRFQPLHAVYKRKTCLAAVEKALEAGEAKMNSFYKDLEVLNLLPEKVKEFSPTGISFRNINTPEELAEAEDMLSKRLN